MNFTTTRFQRNHDFEAGPSVTHINDIALGRRFPSNFEGTHDNEAGPSRTNISDIVHGPTFPSNFEGTHDNEAGPSRINISDTVHDSRKFDQNFDDPKIFEEAYIPDVDMEATTNVTTSRCRRQGTFLVLPILCQYI
ncbi:hypothetical protein P8452_51329 [Trifolium repens]|nr:hypothetical protein P8452_51329 [Trifolium repens]